MELINLSSYNYLGFAQNEGPCVDEVIETINKLGVATGGARSEGGTKIKNYFNISYFFH